MTPTLASAAVLADHALVFYLTAASTVTAFIYLAYAMIRPERI